MFLNLRANGQKDHLHFSDFDSKIVSFSRVISLFDGESVPFHGKFKENNVCFFQLSVQNNTINRLHIQCNTVKPV